MSELQDIAKKLAEKQKVRAMTVRHFLALFGQERRGYKVVSRIRKELKKHGLATSPDFENENIDNYISVLLAPETTAPVPVPKVKSGAAATTPVTASVPVDSSSTAIEEPLVVQPRDAVVTIRQGIPAAGKVPASVRPEEPVMKALSRLMSEKLELLVVQRGDRARVEGIFNYASFTHAHMAGKQPKTVGDCTSHEFIEVNEEKPLIDAVRDIMQHGTVVVRSRQNQLCGVVTARDVAPVFVELAEPFLLLSQIENHLRGLLERANLKKEEYKNLVIESDADRKARTEGPDDLTLGELILAFEQDTMWAKVGLHFDKATLTKRLHSVREIRNKVMHFSPDGLPSDDVTKLKDTRELLEKL
jgi:CBS domain-containing protein